MEAARLGPSRFPFFARAARSGSLEKKIWSRARHGLLTHGLAQHLRIEERHLEAGGSN